MFCHSKLFFVHKSAVDIGYAIPMRSIFVDFQDVTLTN